MNKEPMPEIKSMELLKRLNNYILNENQEFYMFLLEKPNFKLFLIERSNQAHKEYLKAVNNGISFPTDKCNYVLFRGLENNLKEYLLHIIIVHIPDFFDILEKQAPLKRDEIINIFLVNSFEFIWHYIDYHYSEIQQELDQKIMDMIKNKIQDLNI